MLKAETVTHKSVSEPLILQSICAGSLKR